MPAAACCTVGWIFTARCTASSKVTVSSTWAPVQPSGSLHNACPNVPFAWRIVLPMRTDLRAALARDPRAHEHVQGRDEDDVEECREEHPARHRRANRM